MPINELVYRLNQADQAALAPDPEKAIPSFGMEMEAAMEQVHDYKCSATQGIEPVPLTVRKIAELSIFIRFSKNLHIPRFKLFKFQFFRIYKVVAPFGSLLPLQPLVGFYTVFWIGSDLHLYRSSPVFWQFETCKRKNTHIEKSLE